MAEDDKNIDEVVVEDNEAEPVVETVVDKKPESDDPAAGIEALRKQLFEFEQRAKKTQEELTSERRARETDRLAREEAERRASKSNSDAVEIQRQATQSQYDSVVNALAAANSTMTQAKSLYKQAMSDADFDKAAELAGEIGIAASRIRSLEDGKMELESRNRDNREAPRQQEADPKEAFIRRLPSRSAAWVRSHQDRYFNDSRFQNLVAGAHQIALGRGIPAESDEYFQFIEEQAGLREPEPKAEVETKTEAKPEPKSAAATTTARRSPTPSAPASGSSPAAARSSSSGGAIELTAQERELCRLMDMDEAAYAKQKKTLRDEGLIGNTAH